MLASPFIEWIVSAFSVPAGLYSVVSSGTPCNAVSGKELHASVRHFPPWAEGYLVMAYEVAYMVFLT